MKKSSIVLVFVLGAFAVTSVAFANYGKDNKLTGFVKEKGTLNAIAKAKVKLYKKSGSLKDREKTTSKGKYSFGSLTEGTYKVKVEMTGYRNPSDAKKTSVSKTVKVDGKDKQNLYLQKI